MPMPHHDEVLPSPPIQPSKAIPKRQEGAPPVCPTDEEIITPKKQAVVRKRHDTASLDYVLRSGLAGGLAGCAAKTLIAPLDRVKILYQTSNPDFQRYTGRWTGVFEAAGALYKQNGILGLFQGHSATLLRIFPYAAIKFVAYEQFRAVLIRKREHEIGWRRFMAGSMAGVTSVLFTYPLEVIRVRLAFETRADHPTSFSRICREIYHERDHFSILPKRKGGAAAGTALHPAGETTVQAELAQAAKAVTASAAETVVVPVTRPLTGIANFYRGFAPTIAGMLPYAGVSFWTHDMIGDVFRSPNLCQYTVLPLRDDLPADSPRRRKPPLTVWAELTAGGLAGMLSQTASYPLEVIRRRMQVGGAVGDGRVIGFSETARTIWQAKGMRGFFIGLSIGYVKVIPMVSCSFFVYERMKLALDI